jgi:hypothetical protein
VKEPVMEFIENYGANWNAPLKDSIPYSLLPIKQTKVFGQTYRWSHDTTTGHFAKEWKTNDEPLCVYMHVCRNTHTHTHIHVHTYTYILLLYDKVTRMIL